MNSSAPVGQGWRSSSSSTLSEKAQQLQTLNASVLCAFSKLEETLKSGEDLTQKNSTTLDTINNRVLHCCSKSPTNLKEVTEKIKNLKVLLNCIQTHTFHFQVSLQQQYPPIPPTGCTKPRVRRGTPSQNPHPAKRARTNLQDTPTQMTPLDLLKKLHAKEKSFITLHLSSRPYQESTYYDFLSSTLLAIQAFTKNPSLYADKFSKKLQNSLNQRLELASYDKGYMQEQEKAFLERKNRMDYIIEHLNETFEARLDGNRIKFCWPFTHNNQNIRMILLSDDAFSIVDQNQAIQTANLSIEGVSRGRFENNPILLD